LHFYPFLHEFSGLSTNILKKNPRNIVRRLRTFGTARINADYLFFLFYWLKEPFFRESFSGKFIFPNRKI